jgi:hypothetical protein
MRSRHKAATLAEPSHQNSLVKQWTDGRICGLTVAGDFRLPGVKSDRALMSAATKCDLTPNAVS